MSILSRLFGGGKQGGKAAPEPELHDGFRIYPEPIREGSEHRIAARIEKEIGGQTKCHQMIRADKCSSAEEATKITLIKAKSLIDQQGETIFD